jgi:hypothetical protein
MALIASLAQLALVGIILQVTLGTIGGGASEAKILMAALTVDSPVPTHERKSGQVMLDRNLSPILRRVTPVTAHPQDSLMNVDGLVTSIAFPVCPGKNAINVTPPAGSSIVPAFQQKAGLIVIERSLRPTFRGVTLAAILSELSLVGIISLVTIETVSGHSPQI